MTGLDMVENTSEAPASQNIRGEFQQQLDEMFALPQAANPKKKPSKHKLSSHRLLTNMKCITTKIQVKEAKLLKEQQAQERKRKTEEKRNARK